MISPIMKSEGLLNCFRKTILIFWRFWPVRKIVFSTKHPLMDLLKTEDFLSKLCKDTFAGYAVSQIKRQKVSIKKIVNPIDKEKKSIPDFCFILDGQGSVPLKKWLQEFSVSTGQNGLSQEKCGLINIDHTKGMYALFYDESGIFGYKGVIQNEEANQVSLSSVPKDEKPVCIPVLQSGCLFCVL